MIGMTAPSALQPARRRASRRLVPASTRPLEARRLLDAAPTIALTPEPVTATSSRIIFPVLATFPVPAGSAPGDFAISLDWGDGTAAGSAGVLDDGAGHYQVREYHTYNRGGTFTITVAVRPTGGPLAQVTTTANVAQGPIDATLAEALDPASDTGTPSDGVTADATPTFRGTALPGSAVDLVDFSTGTFLDLGSTTADADGRWLLTSAPLADGTYNQLTITSRNPTLGTYGWVAVPDLVVEAGGPALAGALDPASDTGTPGDGITAIRTPTLAGTTAPGLTVTLAADPAGPGAPVVLGTATADASGRWALAAPALPDGAYAVVAGATDPAAGSTRTVALPPLVIDTVGPTLGTLAVDRPRGRFALTILDATAGPDAGPLLDPASYQFRLAGARKPLRVSGLTIAGSGPAVTVSGRLDGGRRLPGGPLALLVRASGVRDLADNPLPGGDRTIHLAARRRVLTLAAR